MVRATLADLLRLAGGAVTTWLELVFNMAEPGENGYWLIRKGGEDSFTRTSPKLPSPRIVEPR